MSHIDHTHDPALRSWIEPANDPASEFPIQNLPYCTFSSPSRGINDPRPGIAIGDRIVDLRALSQAMLLPAASLRANFTVNDLASLSTEQRRGVRSQLVALFKADNHLLRDNPDLIRTTLLLQHEAVLHLPCAIANYTDFYASINHASTVGAMFRPDQPLLPNYKHVPIGYHGRASSLVPSGTDIHRPRGQQAPPDASPADGPSFGPSKLLDYELEVGCVIAQGNELGNPIPVGAARDHIFGLCLVNDWSARDLQKWEYQPLGPFLAKNFGTTVSPFIVTLDALEPFRVGGFPRPASDPAPLAYLTDATDKQEGGFDIHLEISLQSRLMREQGIAPVVLCKGNAFAEMYWTFAQMIAHHTCNGCNFQPGDLIASGTVSGKGQGERGCLLESTWDGPGKPRLAIELPTQEKRTFLADGDRVTFRGWCERAGFRRISLGECTGTIVPA